jgi:hypothetical protein
MAQPLGKRNCYPLNGGNRVCVGDGIVFQNAKWLAYKNCASGDTNVKLVCVSPDTAALWDRTATATLRNTCASGETDVFLVSSVAECAQRCVMVQNLNGGVQCTHMTFKPSTGQCYLRGATDPVNSPIDTSSCA